MNGKIWAWLPVLLVTLLIPLLVTDRYYMHILITCAIYAIIASGLNLVVGYMGYISFGHNALYGIGGYASALLMQKLGFPFIVSLPVAAILSGVAALAVGYFPLRLRLKGPYFALVTMAFGLVIVSVIHNWVELTGGPLGLTTIPAPEILGFKFSQRQTYYYLVIFFAWVTIFFIQRLMASPLGRKFKSIREDEEMAETIGVNVVYYKNLCFVISGILTGMAGSLFAHYSRFLGPDMFSLMEATDMLIMVIIGGMGTLIGPVVGAVIIVILPEVLRGLAEYRQVLYSALLIFAIMFIPSGSVGLWNLLFGRVRGKNV
jgi:branched-chain amino acid transport system permease protein